MDSCGRIRSESNETGFFGVQKKKGKKKSQYHPRITVDGVQMKGGCFSVVEDAADWVKGMIELHVREGHPL